MRIDEVQIVYPYIQYHVIASHNTPRIPTAVEWLILEIIRNCSKIKDYDRIPVGMLFNSIFFISDVDKLIKPCLVSLRDMNIIKASNLYDDMSLDNLYLSEIGLTEDGKMFVDSGTLPTNVTQDSFDIVYDVYNNTLMDSNPKLPKTKAEGFYIGDMEKYNDKKNIFPEGIVFEKLNKLKTLDFKQRAGFAWLNPATSITDLQAFASEQYFRISKHAITITENGKLDVADLKDKDVSQFILENKYANNDFMQSDNLVKISVEDWDSEINEVFPLEQITTKIQSRISSQSLYVIQNDIYKRLHITKGIGASLKTCIISGAEEFAVSFINNNLIIKLEEVILNRETLYQDQNRSVCQGLFNLHGYNEDFKVPFAFIPSMIENDLQKTILPIIEEYLGENYHLILLYLQFNRIDLYKELAMRHLDNLNNLEDQISFIEEMNSITNKVFSKKYLTNEVISRFLVDNVVNNFEGNDIQDVINFFEDKNRLNIYIRNDYLYMGLLKGILPQLNDAASYMDLQKLWEQLNKLDKNKLNFVRNSKLYTKMYGATTFNSYVKDFCPKNDYAINLNYAMPIDDSFVKLKRVEKILVDNLMPNLLDYGQVSDELACRLLAKHYTGIDGIKNNLNNWENELLKLEEHGFDINCYRNTYLDKCNDAFKALSRNISYFYDDKVDNFSKLYVADTSALINHPEIIDNFVNGKSMLIISRVVLQELDGLKENVDEVVAYKARKTINKIAEYRGCEWLNLYEDFDPMYLPQELDPKVKDNQILALGVKYYLKQPIFISDDNNACNIATSLKLRTLFSEDFLNKDSQASVNKKKNKKDKKDAKDFPITNPDNTNGAVQKLDKNKPINANDLAKELGISVFELNKRYSSKFGKITTKSVISPKNANMIRKEYQIK